MKTSAKIICDTQGPNGARLTTFVLTYPRIIHGEMLVHRVFSRSSESSRARPFKSKVQEVIHDPFIPSFLANKPGMQPGGPVADQERAKNTWLKARRGAVECAKQLDAMGVSKQVVNRLLEPYSYITVVLTSTDFSNFFELRCHPDAQIEIQELAYLMKTEYEINVPKKAGPGYWHLPFVDADCLTEVKARFGVSCIANSQDAIDLAIKRSVARCARVSYNNHDGSKTTIEQDLKLYDRLVGSRPLHASPAEHQGMTTNEMVKSRNFTGFVQYRELLEKEEI